MVRIRRGSTRSRPADPGVTRPTLASPVVSPQRTGVFLVGSRHTISTPRCGSFSNGRGTPSCSLWPGQWSPRPTLSKLAVRLLEPTHQPFTASTLQPINPSPLRPFNPSTLQPFNPSTLPPASPSTLQPISPRLPRIPSDSSSALSWVFQ